jgi:DNA-binding transcriptional LysR family regulator
MTKAPTKPQPAISRAIQKLEDDLEYRLPHSNKPLSTIVFSREIAEELLAEIHRLRAKLDIS